MTLKRFFRALMSGITFPAMAIPIGYAVLYYLNPRLSFTLKTQLLILFIPLMFGLVNVAYVRICEHCPAKKHNSMLIATGLLFGLALSLINVPTFIWGAPRGWEDKSIVVLPIICALIFRIIINWYNHMIDVQK